MVRKDHDVAGKDAAGLDVAGKETPDHAEGWSLPHPAKDEQVASDEMAEELVGFCSTEYVGQSTCAHPAGQPRCELGHSQSASSQPPDHGL